MSLKKELARKTIKIRRKFIQKKADSHKGHIKRRLEGKLRCIPTLKEVYNNTKNIKAGDRILLTMGRDENSRIPYFLEYYRDLGIDHFFFIDNDSVDPMEDILENMSDVSLWHTKDSYSGSNYGVDWMNAINGQYGVGHWVLTVDLDEFFVFPLMENRSYSELLVHLETMEKPSLFAPLIDMYPDGLISDAVVPTGKSPLNYANHFDISGYIADYGWFEDVWLKTRQRGREFMNTITKEYPDITILGAFGLIY